MVPAKHLLVSAPFSELLLLCSFKLLRVTSCNLPVLLPHSSIGYVTVTSSSASLCSVTPAVTQITFNSNHGQLPLIAVDQTGVTGGTVTILEVTPGTKGLLECSNRGVCSACAPLPPLLPPPYVAHVFSC